MKKIVIIILNYNGFEDTKNCLSTLNLLEDKSYKFETVVIDNGSKTEELKNLRTLLNKKYSGIKLITNGKNLGFAKGNNVGIKYALDKGADYIFLLNNDTLIEHNFLKNLLVLDKDISSPIVKFQEFKDKSKLMYDLGGFVNWWTGRTYHLNAYSEELEKYLTKKYIEVDYIAGCSMLIKREVFEKIGLLDEKYFIYFEDVDFCITAKKNGLEVVVDPKGMIYHKLGGSMDRWSNRAIYRNLTGNLIFIIKHLGWRIPTGLFYLSFLTAKIIMDRVKDHIKGEITKSWKGAKHKL